MAAYSPADQFPIVKVITVAGKALPLINVFRVSFILAKEESFDFFAARHGELTLSVLR